jgi:hypothetical protein
MFYGKRIRELEAKVRALESQSSFETMGLSDLDRFGFYSLKAERISVKDALAKVLDHIGLDLKFKSGKAATFVVEPKPKKKAR